MSTLQLLDGQHQAAAMCTFEQWRSRMGLKSPMFLEVSSLSQKRRLLITNYRECCPLRWNHPLSGQWAGETVWTFLVTAGTSGSRPPLKQLVLAWASSASSPGRWGQLLGYYSRRLLGSCGCHHHSPVVPSRSCTSSLSLETVQNSPDATAASAGEAFGWQGREVAS